MTTTQPDLFAELNRDTAPARHSDPETSHKAAAMPFRRDSQRHRLLAEYASAQDFDDGLTDEEAAEAAGVFRGCPWKRCSELREMGMIAPLRLPDGSVGTRVSTMGAEQRVCKITEKGRKALEVLA